MKRIGKFTILYASPFEYYLGWPWIKFSKLDKGLFQFDFYWTILYGRRK